MIRLVEETYTEYPYKRINHIWMTRQSIFNEILEHHGDNIYKIPHMKKQKLELENRLTIALELTVEALA
jgi:hypothetical protein